MNKTTRRRCKPRIHFIFHDLKEFSDDIMSRHVLSKSFVMMKFSSFNFNKTNIIRR